MCTLVIIDPRDLLQVDATVITGILILMTISAFNEKKFELKFWGHPREFISFSIVPFSISAGGILLGTLYDFGNEHPIMGLAELMTSAGFVILVITIVFTAISISKNS